jgi:hypothetical protein
MLVLYCLNYFTSPFFVIFFFFVVVGFELRAYTLSHSASPFLMMTFFEIGFLELFAWLALNRNPPDLCLLSSQDYRCEPLAEKFFFFNCLLLTEGLTT